MTKTIVEMKLAAWQEREDLIVALMKERDALLDALEEARADVRAMRLSEPDFEAMAREILPGSTFNEQRDAFVAALHDAYARGRASRDDYIPLPAAAPPVGADEQAAAQTGEDHYDATKHVIGERARDWIERNRS